MERGRALKEKGAGLKGEGGGIRADPIPSRTPTPVWSRLTHNHKERFTVLRGTETPRCAERFRIFATFFGLEKKTVKTLRWALE